jgi:hypothetical protein
LSQLESFDLKPDAPADIRGDFRPIATKTPGIEICEYLPQLAKRSDYLAATIYQAFGLPATIAWHDTPDRPHYVYRGEPIGGLS